MNLIADNDGNNLIILAVMTGKPQLCDSLLQKGVNVNFKNKFGNTPLHMAIMNGFLNCIDTLISYGANEHMIND